MRMDILISGVCGRLGSLLYRLLQEGVPGFHAVGGIDPSAAPDSGFLTRPEDFAKHADGIIDFSRADAAGPLCRFAVQRHLPLVVATTGHSERQRQLLSQAAQVIPVFHTANLSVGVALLTRLTAETAAALPQADVEIVECHRRGKLDAPSGTALALADTICRVLPERYPHPGRSGTGQRDMREIGLHALRLGDRTGEHTVLFDTGDECITLTHRAQTPRIYAYGALRAMAFLSGRGPGLYDMEDLLRDEVSFHDKKEEVIP